MTLKTVLNKVIVEPAEAETGNGKADEPMEVKAGDTVLFGKYSGTEIHIDDKKYLVMNQSDILVVL